MKAKSRQKRKVKSEHAKLFCWNRQIEMTEIEKKKAAEHFSDYEIVAMLSKQLEKKNQEEIKWN